jgi:hypothetical protein
LGLLQNRLRLLLPLLLPKQTPPSLITKFTSAVFLTLGLREQGESAQAADAGALADDAAAAVDVLAPANFAGDSGAAADNEAAVNEEDDEGVGGNVAVDATDAADDTRDSVCRGASSEARAAAAVMLDS